MVEATATEVKETFWVKRVFKKNVNDTTSCCLCRAQIPAYTIFHFAWTPCKLRSCERLKIAGVKGHKSTDGSIMACRICQACAREAGVEW